MEQLISRKVLMVKGLYLKGKTEPLRDCMVWLAGNFLVVTKEGTEDAPTWYNINDVEIMEGVTPMREPSRTRLEQRIGFF